MKISLLFVFLFIFLSPFESFAQKEVVVVIDPGHGGTDPGHLPTNSKYLSEKELNLKIAKHLGGYIEKYLQHVKVVYTRTGDTYPSLDDRVNTANSTNADYFISIHCNGNDRKGVRGTETHVHSMHLSKSVAFAKEVERQFSKRAGRKSRGVKDMKDLQHTLQVLKYTNMTSVLIECGFVTNDKEAAYLNSTHGQEIIASAIFRAFRTTIESEFPTTTFKKPKNSDNSDVVSSNSNTFSIQIASSKQPIDTDDYSLAKSKMDVKRIELKTTSAYKYIYTVGSYNSKKEAKEELELIKQRGFKDAFILKR